MAEQIQILGLKEAYAMMEELTAIEKQKIIIGTLTNAANKNIKAKLTNADSFLPSTSRKKKPFVTVKDKDNSLGVVSGVSGDYFHYRFLEFGTKQRFTKPYKTKKVFVGGKKKIVKTKKKMISRGMMKRNPFIINVIESNLLSLTNYFIDDYGKQVKKRLDRLARKKA
jgi:HK97 gp10 family phage protein